MRFRSFIGLVILMIALTIVSSPALLAKTSTSVDSFSRTAGILAPKPEAPPEEPRPRTVASSTLLVDGHERIDGNLRDTFPDGARAHLRAGRLAAGTRRVRLPGELPSPSPTDLLPLYGDDGGLVLDRAGCPILPTTVDIRVLRADATAMAAFAAAIGASDNAAACKVVFDQRMLAAQLAAEQQQEDPRTIRARRHADDMDYAVSETIGLMIAFEQLLGADSFDELPAYVGNDTTTAEDDEEPTESDRDLPGAR